MSARPLVYLLDAHYQIFRAYHSMPDLRAPDGRPVGALRGYTAALLKFLTRQAPTHVAAAFDFDLTSFRNELYPDYKLGRTEAPADLEPQFALCEYVTLGLGIPVYKLERYEADDVIATLVGPLVDAGAEIAIVTRDKDLGALVSDRVSLFDLKTEAAAGPAGIKERLGVPPELVGDYLTLVGDAVDGIPGVKGIGAKTACALLNHFGGLDQIPHDQSAWLGLELRGAARIAARLAAATDEIALSRQLVRMRDDLPLDVSLDGLAYRGADRERLEAVLAELGAASLLERVPRWA